MAANQKLRRENPLLVPTGTGYFLNGKINISPQNQAFLCADRYFVGFRQTRLIFGAPQST
ncbi:hypothetical protein HK44_025430 [Pseudomonas fluorescens HK44]|uniref:Uncharacterized protein n=1 Tax=Pseudomonas fluorescens HK44 TaxID=1042209 RepID=A0A010RSR1_PSEFL|nr:hypothetical protein HK44_025430 [Pseudomonas fluorescens HK44]